MQAKHSLYAFLLLMFALFALYFYSSFPRYTGAAAAHRPADAWLANPRAIRHAPSSDPAEADLPAAGAGVPLAAQIDLLISTGSPADALRAYWLVQACVDIAEKGTLLKEDAQSQTHLRGLTDEEYRAQTALCAGMTERIKMSRLDHIAIAARAGVGGADDAFLRAGPFGDRGALKTRPGDPLVKAWRVEAEQLLTAHAEAGDMLSMLTLMQEYSGHGETLDADPALALRYTYAVSEIFDRMLSRSDPKFPNPYKAEVERALRGELSTEQVTTAIAAGKDMAEKAAELQAKNRADAGR
ncbi:hypothetical protein [Burkholderia sp. LMU1-1-1.1]|uniref:hypothetical protein n=1 Tax=Burkholderia sp. LMU1-1-1.1 TaxID=3135266 RepID=UPI0034374099